MTDEVPASPGDKSLREEFQAWWRQMPSKGLFFGLLAGWLALFQFLGNSTLGYINTSSLFGWLDWMYRQNEDDAHGRLIPLLVLFLFWWKRKDLMAVSKRSWWPAVMLLLLGLLLHMFGFLVQQTQISVVGFFVGLYGLMGLVWGPKFLLASFFPFCLFAFCLPLHNVSEPITFPLRMVATKITTGFCHVGLGINVIQDGTSIFNSDRTYTYEVAAACSGIRSLTAIMAMSVIYAFVMLKSPWRRIAIIASCLPLAVAANVFRLTSIIIAAEAFGGQSAGLYVHDSTWISLLPYLPAIFGILLLGHWLREDKKPRQPIVEPILSVAAKRL
jgi:exosortase